MAQPKHALTSERTPGGALALLMPIAIAVVVALVFCVLKSGFFIDEIYSFGLANSYFAPFIKDMYNGDITGVIVTQDALLSYTTVNGGEGFNFDSVYYNQTQDVHPPLYYCILHLVSSLFPGSYSKWIGLSINVVLFALTLLVLFKLCDETTGSRFAAALTTVVYGLSRFALSTVLIIRMYMLLSLFTVLFAYLLLRIHREDKPLWYVLLFVTTFCGFLTQYFFVFYAAFVSVAYVLYLLFTRGPAHKVIGYSLCVIGGGLAMVAAFPACLDQLFGNVGELVGGATTSTSIAGILKTAALSLAKSGFVAVIVSLVLLLGIVWNLARRTQRTGKVGVDAVAWIIVLPAFVAYFVMRVAAVIPAERYTFCVIPVLALFVGILAAIVQNARGQRSPLRKGIPAVFLALVVGVSLAVDFVVYQPEYLTYGITKPQPPLMSDEDMDAFIEPHADLPCLYFVTNSWNAPMTGDYDQLVHFQTIATIDAAGDFEEYTAFVRDYLAGFPANSQVVVYTQTYEDARPTDQMLAYLRDSLGLKVVEKPYETLYSRTYLMGSSA